MMELFRLRCFLHFGLLESIELPVCADFDHGASETEDEAHANSEPGAHRPD